MTTPMELARPATSSSYMTPRQIGSLRAQLSDSLADQRRQLRRHDALLDTLVEDITVDDGGDHDREIARLATDRARDLVEELERALDRLADGTYGTCQQCGRPIPFERLEAIPHARYCVACPRPGSGFR